MDLWLLVGVRAPQSLANPQGVRRPARFVDPLLGPEPFDEAAKAWDGLDRDLAKALLDARDKAKG